ncbi:protein phosphatase [Actinomadura rubrobrunea]|uniref:Protein phosphatase n=1 Tax=Actinomadura rubrobrunea TaxID=115335 RepID=A0A9W6PXB1_9ACTN|nr:dual specificity protein phosphatase family protein [Actinomadura rubrobrunea]GLW66115.1 protein phosphatase [Actinomadura rubrobrunea]
MRTERRDGAPEADAPWNEIVPGLWMGGHRYRVGGGGLAPAVVGDQFDIVISLHREDGYGPAPWVEHHLFELPDGPLRPEQLEAVCLLADRAAWAVRSGRRVLVRCRAGYNRSGLVVAQTLVTLGFTADDAVFLIRRHRSPWALNNRLFVEYLTTGLDVARLLTGLEPDGLLG